MTALSAVDAYLQDFHQRQTSTTTRAFARFPARSSVADYASSYAALAACVPQSGEPSTVLDLACGDGHLLKLLTERHDSGLNLIGVDMSQGELDVARATLPADVLLLRERAQALSVATGSIDCVLSHMALMLMDDIEQVLAEIRRVLRPRGQLATVVGRSFLLGEAKEVLRSVFSPILKEDGTFLPFGDPRTRIVEGWTALLEGAFDNVTFEDLDVAWQPTPIELWNSLMETYDVDRLSAPAKTALKERLIDALAGLQQSDGTIQTGWGVRLIRAQAKS
jgi:SAM-dependent methyltransferase